MNDANDVPIYAYVDVRGRERALHLGMWLFVASETLLFAGLFALYAGYRAAYPADFAAGVMHNSMTIGTANTFVLIVSSFFVAFGVFSLRAGSPRACMLSLGVALLLGATFLVLKGIEYSSHLAKGIAPGPHYHYAALPSGGVRTFFTLYYSMTFLHALHVIAGMAILAWLIFRVRRRRTTPERYMVLEMGGLYWHLVDIMWIFLWPLLYLAR